MKKAKQVWLWVWHASGERQSREPLVTQATCSFAYHARTLTTHSSRELHSSLRSSPIFELKRDCSQSMSSTKEFACNVREQLFLYWFDCDEPFRMDLVAIYYSSFSNWVTQQQVSLNPFSSHKRPVARIQTCVTFSLHALHLIKN